MSQTRKQKLSHIRFCFAVKSNNITYLFTKISIRIANKLVAFLLECVCLILQSDSMIQSSEVPTSTCLMHPFGMMLLHFNPFQSNIEVTSHFILLGPTSTLSPSMILALYMGTPAICHKLYGPCLWASHIHQWEIFRLWATEITSKQTNSELKFLQN